MKPLTSVEGTRALEVVVCLEDSIIDVIHLRSPGQVRAGHDAGCQVVLPAEAPAGGAGIVLASLDATGQAYAARELDGSGGLRPIEPADNVSLEAGKLRVFVRTVPDTAAAVRRGWRPDRRTLNLVAASLAGHLLFVWLLLAIPKDARAVNGMDFYRLDRAVRLTNLPNEEALHKPPPPGKGDTGADAPQGAATAAHEGPSGKMGRPEITAKASYSSKGDDATERPSGDVRIWVNSRGVLGVMRSTDFSPILGIERELARGDRWAYAGDLDAPPGDGTGTLGAGYDGTQQGGCPPGTKYCNGNTIGVGTGPTIGRSGGPGWEGTGPGMSLHARDHVPGTPPRVGPITVSADGLDKEMVKRRIHDHIDAIGYCYERQLSVQDAIGGTITVEFVIGPNGSVISARGDGSVGSRTVDECVLQQVRGIQFPRSQGMTNVKYPFTFHTAGR